MVHRFCLRRSTPRDFGGESRKRTVRSARTLVRFDRVGTSQRALRGEREAPHTQWRDSSRKRWDMRGFRIGRIFGVDLRVDWSWGFIFVLLTWNLFAVFSSWHPNWPPLEAFGIALLASLAFFGSILLHELAHTAVAMSYGLRVRSITLFLFGGISNIEQEPSSPGAELLMAIVG